MRVALFLSVLLVATTSLGTPVYRCTAPLAGGAVTVDLDAVGGNAFTARTRVVSTDAGSLDSGVVPVKHFVNPDGGPSLWSNFEADYSLIVYDEQLGMNGLEAVELTGAFVDVVTKKFSVFDRAVLTCTK